MFFAFLLFSFLFGQSSSIDNGWEGIQPLISDRTHVEHIFGKATIDKYGYNVYENDRVKVMVNYSTCACSEQGHGRGKYDVPPDTVLFYQIGMKELSTNLSDLTFDRTAYTRDTSGDVKVAVAYHNDSKGVHITTFIMGGEEKVASIRFNGTPVNHGKFKCS